MGILLLSWRKVTVSTYWIKRDLVMVVVLSVIGIH